MKLNQHNRVKTPFGDFQIDVDNLVDHFFGDALQKSQSEPGWAPRISVLESDNEYQMIVELAGVNPADVSIEMKEGRLEISGEKTIAAVPEEFTVLREERVKGSFKRAFEFSTLVDADRIVAQFKNGILELVLPKSEKVLPRKIEISVSE
jgi:HSP20 family protein